MAARRRGLARKSDEQSKTQAGAILGTPSYMAPEQAEDTTGRQVLHITEAILWQLTWSGDGKRISGADALGSVETYDAETTKKLDSEPVESLRNESQPISPDGRRQAFIEGGEVRVRLLGEKKNQP